MRRQVIGLPRSLLYHRYGVLWTAFFEALGCETVVSEPSNKRTLEHGVRLAVDETCLPAKIELGHIYGLRGKVDAVLVPRIVSLARREEVCVKMAGLYDVVRNAIPDVRVITYTVDERLGRHERTEMCRLGRRFCANPFRVRAAYTRAVRAQVTHDRVEVERHRHEIEQAPDAVRILVAGHTYNIDDELIGMPIRSYLESQGAFVLTSEWMDRLEAHALAPRVSKRVKWTYNMEILGAVEHFRSQVDGIIFVVTFPCGPDSLITELCRLAAAGLPNMTLVIDELQCEGGLHTRVESFVDIVKLRKEARAHSA
jgi:predicted nucleotide-binding protein (sugar kinase/HSP70/actin superfamily)